MPGSSLDYSLGLLLYDVQQRRSYLRSIRTLHKLRNDRMAIYPCREWCTGIQAVLRKKGPLTASRWQVGVASGPGIYHGLCIQGLTCRHLGQATDREQPGCRCRYKGSVSSDEYTARLLGSIHTFYGWAVAEAMRWKERRLPLPLAMYWLSPERKACCLERDRLDSGKNSIVSVSRLFIIDCSMVYRRAPDGPSEPGTLRTPICRQIAL